MGIMNELSTHFTGLYNICYGDGGIVCVNGPLIGDSRGVLLIWSSIKIFRFIVSHEDVNR